jgi:branched-chain amino acid transport system substrate-binding protein
MEKGLDIAFKQINDEDFLEGTTLELEMKDTGSQVTQSVSTLAAAVRNDDYPLVFGAITSQDAVAMSPIAEKAKLPIVYTQAGSDGVLIGDYTFRVTTPQPHLYPLLNGYLQKEGTKKIGILYSNSVPTLETLGTKTIPEMADEIGAEVVSTVGVPSTTQDFSAPINQILDKGPDTVAILQVGAPNAVAMKQLREAGFDGPVLGNLSAGKVNLEPAGPDGAGMVWVADFHPDVQTEETQTFVELYQEEYGEEPSLYAAEAYDAAWMVARALKAADSIDRQEVQKALDAVADAGFTGAMGDLTFTEDHDLRVTGHAVLWDGTNEVLLDDPAG